MDIQQAHNQLARAKAALANMLAAREPTTRRIAELETFIIVERGKLARVESGEGIAGNMSVAAWLRVRRDMDREIAEATAELASLRSGSTAYAQSDADLRRELDLAVCRVVVAEGTQQVETFRELVERARQAAARIEAARSFVLDKYTPGRESSAPYAAVLNDFPSIQDMTAIANRPMTVTEFEITQQIPHWQARADALAAPEPQDTMQEAAQ